MHQTKVIRHDFFNQILETCENQNDYGRWLFYLLIPVVVIFTSYRLLKYLPFDDR